MVKRLRIAEGRLIEDGDNAQVLVYIRPDESEKKHLVEGLKLDEHTFNSALDPDELARLEFEPEHLAVIYKRPKNYSSEDKLMFKVNSAGLFLFKDRLVIVVPDDSPLFEGRHFQRLTGLHDVLLKLIYRSVFHFIEHLKVINALSSSLEQQINTAMENRYLLNLFTLEKSLVYYLNAINSNAKVIGKLRLNAAKIGLAPENVEFLDDLQIENTQCYEQAETYSNILASLMDARVSIVSNNLNVLMKTLNIIVIMLMVPTLIVSAFSMNVNIPWTEYLGPFFWGIMGVAAVAVTAFILFWRFKRW